MSASSRAASSAGSAGSTSALWNARVVFSRRTRTPSSSRRRETPSMPAAGPLTTWWAPLSAEMFTGGPEDLSFQAATAAATRSAGAKAAAMAPGGVADSRAPRASANRIPSSSGNTPAACAAAISPTLCPITTSGRIPTLAQSAVSAHSSA